MEAVLISIVIPCKNEAANLPSLLDEIEVAMMGQRFEVVVVDDGSTDGTQEVLAAEASARKCCACSGSRIEAASEELQADAEELLDLAHGTLQREDDDPVLRLDAQ